MKKFKDEQWKQIKGYPDYFISDYGRIKSFKRKKDGYIRKEIYGKHGYSKAILTKIEDGKNKQYTYNCHTLVWDYFNTSSISRDGRKIVIDHIDNDKKNNHIKNLQLLTHRDNLIKGFIALGKQRVGVRYSEKSTQNPYYSTVIVDGNYKYLGSYPTQIEAQNAYNLAYNLIQKGEIDLFKFPRKNKYSQYPGLSKNKSNKWVANITINLKTYYIGSFNTEIKAYNAYKWVKKNKSKFLENKNKYKVYNKA